MDLDGFKKIIGKSNRRNILIGTFVGLFGAFMLWLALSGADSEMEDISTAGMVVLWLLIAICLGLGGFVVIQAIGNGIQVRSGNHPLIKAINDGDKGYLIWIYEHITKSQGGGVSSHHVWAYNQKGKKYIFSVKKDRVRELIGYLGEQFPNAVVGYSEEIAARMKQNLGKKRI